MPPFGFESAVKYIFPNRLLGATSGNPTVSLVMGIRHLIVWQPNDKQY